MSSSFKLHHTLYTEDLEKRLCENVFSLTKNGYHLYPINETIFIRKSENGRLIGQGHITTITWENYKTTLEYELTSLETTN